MLAHGPTGFPRSRPGDRGDDGDSIIACGPDGSWRYYVQPIPFTAHCDLDQSAGGTLQLPLPPPGLSRD